MPTNPYINNFDQTQEKALMENVIIESIKLYGQEMYWIPRKSVNEDQIFGEDTLSRFDDSYLIKLYIKSIEGFEGEGDFISRFGLEIRDQVTLTMAQRKFSELGVGDEFPRPREGDLIYMPLNKKIFEILHVEHESIFYQAGGLPVYDLRCELFRYSSEVIATGIWEIDKLAVDHSQVVTTDDETSMPDSSIADNKKIEDAADSILEVLDFDESNPFGSF